MHRATNIVSIDFDYWYLGLNIAETFHCGRCCKKTDRPTELDTRFSKPDITTNDVINLVQPSTPVYVSECHADITKLLKETRDLHPNGSISIYNIDSHSDAGTNRTLALYCGNWVTVSKRKGTLDNYQHIRKKQEFVDIPTPSVVYICRSSAYLLESGDISFVEFVHALEKKCGTTANVIGFDSKAIMEMLQ